ncbi:MAG: hypothetical protein ACERKN_18565 [Velocimicrobium sp.]
MKKLQIISKIVLALSLIGFILFRYVLSVSDWTVRVVGILLLISIFTTVFSSVRTKNSKK